MNEFSVISIPLLAGLLLYLVPERFRLIKGGVSLAVSGIVLWMGYVIYCEAPHQVYGSLSSNPLSLKPPLTDMVSGAEKFLTLNIDNLSKLIVLLICIFAFLVMIYSVAFKQAERIKHYFSWFIITLGCANGATLADNLLLFLSFWGVLGITLYKLICSRDEAASAAAKKTLILIGASDSIMIAGIAILWKITGTLSMNSISVQVANPVTVAAFFALLAGSFTKAGAFPFHTWVPDYAENAPASSSAYLPASLDKLLGIYFLARITTKLFVLNGWISLLLLSLGVITIIGAVLMALVQHDYRRLLGFHAVSQVGYMILGFGLGSAIGVAAGLFHLVNNAIYKSGLFLSAGAVEYRTGKKNIEDLGGLSKAMPLTFFAALVFALSISGVPPLNGFASKWMIYQGIIDFGNGTGIANKLWFLWLGLAVFGSSLTLASFIKFIGGIFLSRRKTEFEKIREVGILMWIPMIILALLCIIIGVFATNFTVQKIFMPVSGDFKFTGFWDSSTVAILVLLSILLGILIYYISGIKRFRHEDSFIGGEKIQDETGYPTPEFYKTIQEFRFTSWIFRKAEEKWFDIYEISKKAVLWLSHQFSDAHTGVLPGYILWVFAGLIIMLLIMI
jgi:formate hydrogenlyase subunit 3/multisubunit Na+/H+ antiporter MnhD subunit